ncbi:biotin--[acetyl-CoA-carboxylase] ligase [Desulfomarina sp.]
MDTRFYESIDSTNRMAKIEAERGVEHGTAVVAEKQTNGRGRLGKVWNSVPGKGLYCSIIVCPDVLPERYAQLTLVAGVAVAEVLENVLKKRCQLKWPNDIFFSGKKCGGILTESVEVKNGVMKGKRAAIVGIGLNVNSVLMDFPENLRDMVTSLFLEGGRKHSIKELFEQVRKKLLKEIEVFESGGFGEILEKWRARDFLLGKSLECVGYDGSIVRGVALGPDEKGRMYLRGQDGRDIRVLSGDLRLAGFAVKED